MTGDARLNFEVKGDLMQEKGIRTRAKSKKGASVPGHAMFFVKHQQAGASYTAMRITILTSVSLFSSRRRPTLPYGTRPSSSFPAGRA